MYVQDPIAYNQEARMLSQYTYNANGIVTNTIDYMKSLPTLDRVVIRKGESKSKLNSYKKLMMAALSTFKDKEFIRDCLHSDMINGITMSYCEITESEIKKFPKTMSDFDVHSISEINEVSSLDMLGKNIAMISLPIDYCKIVGIKNSAYVIAFDLTFFDNLSSESKERKLLKYPKEIRDGYQKHKEDETSNNWLVLDNKKTIVHKIRSERKEPWGRPLVLAALNNIFYADYFKETKRNVLNEVNNRIYYQTFPEGKEKGTSALTGKQQETQHNNVRDAIQNKNNKSGTSFFSVAAGTEIKDLKVDVSIFDEKNESRLNDDISTDLGFGASLLNASSSGNFSSQQTNLDLVFAEVMTWVSEIASEINRVINANLINDSKNIVEVCYLPISHVNKDKMIGYMKELYTNGKGSLQAWIASTGWEIEAYLALMDEELELDFENKYPVHQTSSTLSKEESKNGRPPTKDIKNENTGQSKTNNSNKNPKPSTK